MIKHFLTGTFVFFIGCSLSTIFSPPEYSFKTKLKPTDKLAVLTFDQRGSGKSYGDVVADRINEKFFIEEKISPVERGLVKKVSHDLKIISTDYLSLDQIKELGQKLSADYILCGRIELNTSSKYFDPDEPTDIILSLRLINTQTGEVDGIARLKRSGTDVNQILYEMSDDMVNRISWVEKEEIIKPDSVKVDSLKIKAVLPVKD